MLRQILYALTAALLLAGCGDAGDSTGVETRGTSAGSTTYDVASAGFAIAVPESWRTISADEFRDGGKFEAVIEETPALEPYAAAFQGPDSVLKFVAVDPNVRNDFATNLNVIVEELPAGTTLDAYEEAFISQLGMLPTLDGEVTHRHVELPGGEAARVSYRQRLATGSTRVVSTLQYVLVGERAAYILTYSTLPGLAGAYEATFAQSAESLRLN